MTDFEVGWVAGILDGEGCLSICCDLRKRGNYYIPQVIVNNTDKRMLDVLYKLTSFGHVTKRTKYTHQKQSWTWQVRRLSDIAVLLIEVYPYLVTKKEQASVLLKLCVERSTENNKNAETYFNTLKVLNKRGE